MITPPPPSASNIDVSAERLRDVERRRMAPAPNIAASAVDALKVGSAVVELTEDQKARQIAQEFQKNYVDKGWEGYEKLWQEAGAPAAAAPQVVRGAYGDSPAAAFKYLGELNEKKQKKEATQAFADSYEAGGGDKAVGSAIRGDLVKPETVVKEMGDTARAEAAAKARKEIASEKIELQRTQKILDRAVAWARVGKAAAGADPKTLKKYQDEKDAADAEIASLEASGTSLIDPNKLSDARTRRRGLIDAIRRLEAKLPTGDPEGDGGGSGPKEGDTKTNSAGDKLVYRSGAWQLQ